MSIPNFKDAVKNKVPSSISKTFNEMFEILPDTEQKIVAIPCYKLIIDENQPFKLYTEEQLKDLAERIKRCGLLNPITVRPENNDKYKILSGRNRAKAVMLNGDNEINAIVCDVDDDTAALIMIDANLGQREELFPSEKAFAYKMEVEILNRRGTRTDLALGNGCPKYDSREIVGEKHSESKRTITNYIRLTYLIPELLALVDEKKIQFTAGVELSYLNEKEQKILLDEYINNGVKLSKEQISSLKELSKENKLNIQVMSDLLKDTEKFQNEKPLKTIKLDRKRFSEFSEIINNEPDITQLFLEFLKTYKNKNN